MKKRSVSVTNVWRATLESVHDLAKSHNVLVLADEEIPGKDFSKAIRDQFEFLVTVGTIGAEERFDDYRVSSTNLIGRAVGKTSKNKVGATITIAKDGRGRALKLDVDHAQIMAGLTPRKSSKIRKLKPTVLVETDIGVAPMVIDAAIDGKTPNKQLHEAHAIARELKAQAEEALAEKRGDDKVSTE